MEKNLENILNARNIKPTAMRTLVLQILLDQNSAISLPELEQKFYKADKSTIYRTLKTFLNHRLIHSIEDGTGSLRYAVCKESCNCEPEQLHVHFLCNNCNSTFCLLNSPIPIIELPKGFKQTSSNFVIKGVCLACSK
ncbi:MAG: transcriptional repressor [Bacteroidetes bacterium]|nr:transcriptional repressor [Bacteroidota bacterium]|tara:strand:- start:243 stop:656 length:414 start_codon:yes stop_codon:yes gene_type:complete